MPEPKPDFEFKYTTGPWEAQTDTPTHYGAIRIVAPQSGGPDWIVGWATDKCGETLDPCGRNFSHRDPKVVANNARLLALAPRMYETLLDLNAIASEADESVGLTPELRVSISDVLAAARAVIDEIENEETA